MHDWRVLGGMSQSLCSMFAHTGRGTSYHAAGEKSGPIRGRRALTRGARRTSFFCGLFSGGRLSWSGWQPEPQPIMAGEAWFTFFVGLNGQSKEA